MIQRRTQTATYWFEEFELAAKDVSFLYDLLLDRGEPMSSAALTQVLMERHCQLEERAIRAGLSNGRLYQPRDLYEVGARLIFPALDLGVGTVVATRPGSNPDYGDFAVIRVQMEEDDRVREFASGLIGDHSLNRPEGREDLLALEDGLAVSVLYEAYGTVAEEQLLAELRRHDEFVEYRQQWFLRGLLAPIHAGHLNIAEALIEVKAMPLPASDFLGELELPLEISEPVRTFSVNYALGVDERFDNVGDSGRDVWYLRRLVPRPVLHRPDRLAWSDEPYHRDKIGDALLAMLREIDDEGGDRALGPSRQLYKSNIALTYPHWRCGTLPLTGRTRSLFPQATTEHTPVVLVDGQTGDPMQGWIVHAYSFVYGLADWYKRHRLPVGAHIRLERTRDPRMITVDFQPQRLLRQWFKVATVQEGRLVFQMRKLPVSCEYDEHLAIGEDEPELIDDLWDVSNSAGESLYEVMLQIMPELVKLSPQGTVHAKTIYSAVNVLKRVPPGPIFAMLSTEPCFVSMGGGYWTFDAAGLDPDSM